MSAIILSEPEGMSSKEQFSYDVTCALVKMHGEIPVTASDEVKTKAWDCIYSNLNTFDKGYNAGKTAKTVAAQIFKRNKDNSDG